MPSIAAHYAVAAEVERILQFRNDSFYYGCILPDIIATQPLPSVNYPICPYQSKHRHARRVTTPHRSTVHKIYVAETHYKIFDQQLQVGLPDLERFWRETELSGYMQLGYAAHLMTDRGFLGDFCPWQFPGFCGRGLFTKDKIYRDYSCLNRTIIEEFNLDLCRINRVLHQAYFDIPIDSKRFHLNVEWINDLEHQSDPQYIGTSAFIAFLRQIAREVTADPKFLDLLGKLSCC